MRAGISTGGACAESVLDLAGREEGNYERRCIGVQTRPRNACTVVAAQQLQ